LWKIDTFRIYGRVCNRKGDSIKYENWTSSTLLYSFEVAVISCVLLTVMRGMPTADQLVDSGISMFLVAFVVLKFFAGAKMA